MKRILAMLLALTMMLGCTAALAEETAEAAPEALLSMVTLSVDRDFVTTYAASMDAEGTNTYATLAGAALDALEKVHLYVLCGEDTGAVVLGTEDADLATANYLVDDNGLTLVSNLIPHYALRVTPEELQMLAKQMTASMNLTLNGKQLTAEDAQALAAQDMLIVHFDAGESATPFAERYLSCMIEVTGLGGEGGGNVGMPISVTYGGTRTTGTASHNAETGAVTFTPA